MKWLSGVKEFAIKPNDINLLPEHPQGGKRELTFLSCLYFH